MDIPNPYQAHSGPRLQGIGDTKGGIRVNANDFGGDDLDDAWNMAQQLGNLGRTVSGIGIAILDQKAQNDAIQKQIAAETNIANYRAELFMNSTGSNAYDVNKKLEDFTRKELDRLSGELNTPRAKEYFGKRTAGIQGENSQLATRHMLKENEKYRVSSLQALNQQLMNKAMALPEEKDAILGYLQEMQYNNAQLYSGMPSEALALKNEESAFAVIKGVAASQAEQHSAAKAMGFLNDSDVEKMFTDSGMKAQFGALKKSYYKAEMEEQKKAMVNAGIQSAVAITRAGGNPGDVLLQLLDAGIDPETIGKVASGYKTWKGLDSEYRKEIDAAAEARQKEKEERGAEVLGASAGARGRELGKMSEEDMSMTAIREEAYANWPEKYAKMVIGAAEAERTAMKADAAMAAVRRTEQLGRELKEAGNMALNMASWEDMTPEERTKYMNLGDAIRKGIEGAAGPQNVFRPSRYLELQNMSDEDLIELFADPVERDFAIADLGGTESKWFTRVFDRVDPEKRRQGGASGGKLDSEKFLDNELNTINREVRQTLRNTGRSLDKEEMDAVADSVLQYADRRYEEEMRRAEVGKPEDLPYEVRRQIHAEALLTYRSKGWGASAITRAEAWAQGVDVSDISEWSIELKSLPREMQANYLGGQVVEEDGRTLAVNVPYSVLPATVRDAATAMRASARQNLVNGAWELVPANSRAPRMWFGADGGSVMVEDGKDPRQAGVVAGPEESMTNTYDQITDIFGEGALLP